MITAIDTHVHLWNLAHPRLTWNWVDTDDDHPILGNIDAIKMRAFELPHLWAEARFAGVESFVHVQAAIGSADPVEETRWLTAMAADAVSSGQEGQLAAIIGHVDLAEPSAEAVLDDHGASPLFRGVRDFAIEPYLESGEIDPGFERSFELLADRVLVLDLDCSYPQMRAARALAERHPGLTIVLEHIGFPRSRDADYLAAWRSAIADLGAAGNVVCKISGVGMTDPLFTRDSLAPWVEYCLEVFGPDRCMIGSNWPLDRLCSSYDAILDHYRGFVATLSEAEQRRVLADTAREVYRLVSCTGAGH